MAIDYRRKLLCPRIRPDTSAGDFASQVARIESLIAEQSRVGSGLHGDSQPAVLDHIVGPAQDDPGRCAARSGDDIDLRRCRSDRPTGWRIGRFVVNALRTHLEYKVVCRQIGRDQTLDIEHQSVEATLGTDQIIAPQRETLFHFASQRLAGVQVQLMAGNYCPDRDASPNRLAILAAIPATRCDPFRIVPILSRLCSGGVVAPLLNPRLMAVIPSGSCHD